MLEDYYFIAKRKKGISLHYMLTIYFLIMMAFMTFYTFQSIQKCINYEISKYYLYIQMY
jgi:hypothetical protein